MSRFTISQYISLILQILFTALIYIMLSFLLENKLLAFETSAKQAIIMDFETGDVLFEKNSRIKTTPSSMSKLLTTYIAFQNLKDGNITLDDKVLVSENAWRKEGSRMFLPLHSEVSIEDLLHGIITLSGNDASIAMAEKIAGSEEEFVLQMNAIAEKIGLEDSEFKNATGWPDIGHVMSVHDIAKLSRCLIRDFPEYYHFFSKKEFSFNNINQQNRNTLLGKMGIDGLKTGYTESGGNGIVISAKQQSSQDRLIVVVNGLPTPKERAQEAENLMRFGIANFKHWKLFNAGDIVYKAKVWYGAEKEVDFIIGEDIKFVLEKKYKKNDLRVTINYTNPLIAPIQSGQEIGFLSVHLLNNNAPQDENNVIVKAPIFIAKDIRNSSFFGKFIENVRFILGLEK